LNISKYYPLYEPNTNNPNVYPSNKKMLLMH